MRQVVVIEVNDEYVKSLIISNDRRFIIYSNNKTIGIWNILENRQAGVLEGHINCVNSIVTTSDNNLIISGSDDHTIRVWSMFENNQKTILKGHTGSVFTVLITSDDQFVISGSNDKTIRI